MNTNTAAEFAVGDRVHYNGWTDVYPGTVVKVTPTTVTVRMDLFQRDPEWKPEWVVGGFGGHCTNQNQQRNIITEGPDSQTVKFTLRTSNGKYVMAGSPTRGQTSTLRHGWDAFHDYNF